MSSGQIALSRLFSRPLPCSFRFLSPRSRLSVRCLVFKELFVAAVAATRSKFYFISFRLVKSFSKNFCFSFRSSHFRAIKKSRCSRLIFCIPSNEVANYEVAFSACQAQFAIFLSVYRSAFFMPLILKRFLFSCRQIFNSIHVFKRSFVIKIHPNHVHRLVEPAMQG